MNHTSNHNSHINHLSHKDVRSNRMRFALVAAVSMVGLGVSSGSASAEVPPADADLVIVLEQTCPKDGKIDVVGSVKSITVTAPEGKLIAGYCVKAGSAGQGDGPESFVLQPPVEEITFGHSSGKDISHYTIDFVDQPIDDLAPLPDKPDMPDDKAAPVPADEPDMPDDKAAPVPADEPDMPDDKAAAAPQLEAPQPEAPQPETGSAPALPEAQSETPQVPVVSAATTELPVTGSTTNILAGLAAGMTALGLVTRRFARRTA